MSERREHGDRIVGRISGPVSGQAAIGKDISQTQIGGQEARTLTAADRAEVWRAIAELQARIECDAPPHQKDDAMARVGELERAVTGAKADVPAVNRVKTWFADNLPVVAGIVAEILLKVTLAP